MAEMQNPGLEPRASRVHFAGGSHSSGTCSVLREQVLICRFGLSPWIAREVSSLAFGEGGID